MGIIIITVSFSTLSLTTPYSRKSKFSRHWVCEELMSLQYRWRDIILLRRGEEFQDADTDGRVSMIFLEVIVTEGVAFVVMFSRFQCGVVIWREWAVDGGRGEHVE